MALTERDLKLFARSAVPERDIKAAVSFYIQAQDNVRSSGHRVTSRVKSIMFNELVHIQNTANDGGAHYTPIPFI